MYPYQMTIVMLDGSFTELCVTGFHCAHQAAKWALKATKGVYYANVRQILTRS